MTITSPSDQHAVRATAPPCFPDFGPSSRALGRSRPTALLLVALLVGSLASLRAQEADAVPVDVELPAEEPVRLWIAPDAVPLPALDVTVERRAAADGRLAGFHRRLRRGHGHFVTREQIERRDPSRLSHMFRQLPGLTVVRQEFGGTVVSDRPDCRLEFFVDGVRSSFLRMDALRPGDVAGIEVYHGTSRVPPRFVRRDYCGAVVVWTRVPGDTDP